MRTKENGMEMLKVKGHQITTISGTPVQLRGFNIGGWLNMEDFIAGYVGAEHNLRATMGRILGVEKAALFFERYLEYFFSESDVAYMASLGANVLRIPLNYRYFESDDNPFVYHEEGFHRLDQAVAWCAKYGIYVILDLHAAQGWQNPDWHSDNAHVQILLYNHKHFQERATALWKEIARRYAENPVLAGYGLMNEPCTRLEYERYNPSFYDWEGLNKVHRMMAEAIRQEDADHILFVEGDNFATEYDGLDILFDSNIVIETHNYEAPTISPGAYPGVIGELYWNRDIIAAALGAHSGVRVALKHHKPVFVGEFGVLYTGRTNDLDDRVAALDDQLGVFASAGLHWAIWTYKDIGAMGAVNVRADADYIKLIEPIIKAKHSVADWEMEMPKSDVSQALKATADAIDGELDRLGIPLRVERKRFAQFSLWGYLAQFLQVPYAQLFVGLSDVEIDHLLQAFKFEHCVPNESIVETLRKHFQG
jgi:aryl-phospho-beta-D-glucosidase BglC (GH1 family)